MTEVWEVLRSGWARLNPNLLVYSRGRGNNCNNVCHACDDVTLGPFPLRAPSLEVLIGAGVAEHQRIRTAAHYSPLQFEVVLGYFRLSSNLMGVTENTLGFGFGR